MPSGVYKRIDIVERFWSKVDKSSGKESCWLWTAGKTGDGYGIFSLSHKKSIGAHRFSLELKEGLKLSEKEQACHKCDNPICVNPSHLFRGNVKMNADDASIKGRLCSGDRHHSKINPVRGSKHGMSKLNEDSVKEIKLLLTRKNLTNVEIANNFNVTPTTIGLISKNKIWRSVCV